MWCACFFCFKQKTAYEMRISDWSSDVCSSDLIGARRLLRWRELALIGFIGLDRQRRGGAPLPGVGGQHRIIEMDARRAVHQRMMDLLEGRDLPVGQPRYQRELGRASWRERVCQYVSISVVAVALKKKKIRYANNP